VPEFDESTKQLLTIAFQLLRDQEIEIRKMRVSLEAIQNYLASQVPNFHRVFEETTANLVRHAAAADAQSIQKIDDMLRLIQSS
jgi:hypothetical protein